MKYTVSCYTDALMDGLEELFLCMPPYVTEDIAGLINEAPGLSALALYRGGAVGVAARTKNEGGRARMSAFIKKEYRLCRIGTDLCSKMLDTMKADGVRTAFTDTTDEEAGGFIERLGFVHSYDSRFMRYRGDIPAKVSGVALYDDSMFGAVAELLDTAFMPLRVQLGLDAPGWDAALRRQEFSDRADDIFVYEEDGRILGVAMLDGAEIESVAVADSERGRGIGRTLVEHLIAELDLRGRGAHLFVVEGNPALSLYESMGFYTERVHHFYAKEL